MIIFALPSQRYIDFFRIFLGKYIYESVSKSWTIKQRDIFFESNLWLHILVSYFYCVKFVAVTEIAVLRFINCLTRKSLTNWVWKLITIAIPLIIATVGLTVDRVMYESVKFLELINIYHVIYIIRMIVIVMLIIQTLLAAAYRYKKKLNEQLEFSPTCFLILLVMSMYETILYFIFRNFISRSKSWDPMEIYRFGQWKWVFFAIYGLVMLCMDNNNKKAVQGNAQESLELEVI